MLSATDEIDINAFAELGNSILPKFEHLREQDPIHWDEVHGYWVVTDHAAVTEGFSGKLPLETTGHERIIQMFSDPTERDQKIGTLAKVVGDFLTFKSKQEHLRIRKLLMSAFSRQFADSQRPYVRNLITTVLDNLDTSEPVEFIGSIGRAITGKFILNVIGLPERLYVKLEPWALALNEGIVATTDISRIMHADRTLAEMRDEVLAEIRLRQDNPKHDFLSMLMEARDGKDKLSVDEIVAQTILTLIAGHDTTLNTTALSIAALAKDDRARDEFRKAKNVEQCVMELMRIVAMSTLQVRVAIADFEWRGRKIRQGDILLLIVASANRDPKVFERPTEIDFARSQVGNMTFGPGPHFCIGHWFAKMVLSEFFPAFLQRFDHWTVLDDNIQFSAAPHFRGPKQLSLKLYR